MGCDPILAFTLLFSMTAVSLALLHHYCRFDGDASCKQTLKHANVSPEAWVVFTSSEFVFT